MRFFNKHVSETQIKLKDRLWLYIFSGLILFLLIVPSLIVIPMSFSESQYLEFPPKTFSLRWYENYFFSWKVENGFNDWMAATWTSVKVAILTILVATPIGTMAAYGLINSNSRLRSILFLHLQGFLRSLGLHLRVEYNLIRGTERLCLLNRGFLGVGVSFLLHNRISLLFLQGLRLFHCRFSLLFHVHFHFGSVFGVSSRRRGLSLAGRFSPCRVHLGLLRFLLNHQSILWHRRRRRRRRNLRDFSRPR